MGQQVKPRYVGRAHRTLALPCIAARTLAPSRTPCKWKATRRVISKMTAKGTLHQSFLLPLLAWAPLLACNPAKTPSTPAPAGAPPPNSGAAYGTPETPCDSHGADLMVLDDQLRPVDMHSESSLEATFGQPVTVCTAVRPVLQGRVLDGASRSPVPNAIVVVESWLSPAPIGGLQPTRRLLLTADARTDARGAWHMPAASLWLPAILAPDALPFIVKSHCVRAPGYASLVFDPWKHPAGYSETYIAETVLHRSNASETRSTAPTLSSCGISLDPPL
jgi:hypothetical protein